jgi:hypothetical protein
MYIFYKISFLINFLWACVDMFKAVCRSIESYICRADPEDSSGKFLNSDRYSAQVKGLIARFISEERNSSVLDQDANVQQFSHMP